MHYIHNNSIIIIDFFVVYNANVTSGYYGMDKLPANSVNIRRGRCRPRGKFSDCVNVSTEVQNGGCDGLLASVACPGRSPERCIIYLCLHAI